jgi:hypothetical protein
MVSVALAASLAASRIFCSDAYAEQTPLPSELPDLQQELDGLRSEINDLYDWINSNIDSLRQEEPTPAAETEKPAASPMLKLASPMSAQLSAGRTSTIAASIKNVGSSYALGILVQASAPSDAPFIFEFSDNSNNITSLYEGASSNVMIKITVDPDAKAGVYDLLLKFSFKDMLGNSVTQEDALQLRLSGSQAAAAPTLRGFAVEPQAISAGSEFEISAVIVNSGQAAASNIMVSVEGASGEAGGISPSGEAAFSIASLDGMSEQRVAFRMTSPKDIKEGAYPAVFKLSYPGGPEGGVSYSYYAFIHGIESEATQDKKRGRVEVAGVQSPEGVFQAGDAFAVSLSLINNGSATARKVKVTASSAVEGAIVPMSASVQVIGDLAEGESRVAYFRFAPTASAETQNYMVGFKVEYETGVAVEGVAETESFEQYAGVNVFKPPEPTQAPSPEPTAKDERTSKPKIIVSAYKTEPQTVQAGSEFDLTLDFKNTHGEKRINNIKVVLSAVETMEQTGSVFMPVNGSNTIYIDEISPNQESSRTLRMYTVPNALARTYSINVSYEYQDDEYNAYEDAEQIGINVKQVTKLEIGEYYLPESISVYEPVSLGFSIINSGKVNLSNLRVSVLADMDVSAANMYLGSLKIGSSIYYEGAMTPNGPGEIDGTLVVSCEDENGELIELTREIHFSVMEEQTEDVFSDDSDFEQFQEEDASIMGFIKKPPFIIGVSAALAIGIAATAVAIRRKRQKGWLEDE